MRVGRPLAALATVLALGAGCTSSGLPRPSPSVPSPSSSSVPGPSSTPASSSGPTSSTSTPAASGLARLRGAILLLGSNPDAANAYEVTTGAFRALTRLPAGSRVSDVTADRSHVVITDDARTHADHVDVVQGGDLADLGLGAAFGPALSNTGALTWVALEGGAATPGITKPRSFVVGVRDSLRSASRIIYRSPSSLASPQWFDPHAVVIAASNGERTQLVRIDTTTRTTRVLTTIPSSDALDLTSGPTLLTAWDGLRAAIVSRDGRVLSHGPAGWRPLCWLPAGPLLVTRGGQLAVVTVSGGRAGTPQPFATAPPGQSAYAAACGRVHA